MENQGKSIAIISDAGTPAISDPGNILTKILREQNIKYTIIPGANAAISALVLSGLDTSSFYFLGFLPTKKGEKEKILREISLIKSTLIFYISPHRLTEDLKDIHGILGNRKSALVKEITKFYETVYSFNLGDPYVLSNEDSEKSEKLVIDSKGEFVLVVSGAAEQNL